MSQEWSDMAKFAEQMLTARLTGTVATLFSVRGSSYRPLGSMMVGLPGMRVGGISGGCLEDYVARQGMLAVRDRAAAVLTFSTSRDGDSAAPALGCGGSIDVLVERLTPTHVEWLSELAAAADRDAPSVLQCTVDLSVDATGVQRRWIPEIDESCGVASEIDHCRRQVLQQRQSRHIALDSSRRALVQYIAPTNRLIIFGAGDDAQPLCQMARLIGWHVTVADRRSRLATSSRFPTADVVLAGGWDEVVNGLRLAAQTAAVLMTHSLEDDACLLGLLARRTLSYVGVLGPAHRREWLLEEAAAQGADLDSPTIAQLRGPIGLDLGDRAPAGIAVAVIAELLAWTNGREARPLAATPAASRVAHSQLCRYG
jgi:xanthine/CO dehydrogenase XdhC/CoxF family maturation factor